MTENNRINSARKLYNDLGFDSLPLLPQGKRPCIRGWKRSFSYRLWRSAPYNANIGIRGGGPANVAFIDCDEPRAFENITNYLAGLGYHGDDYPVVQSASGIGRHIYITLNNNLTGDWRELSKEIGKGEFRYGTGAFVVAPPSFTTEGSYLLLSGDYSIRPALKAQDVLPLLGNREISSADNKSLPRRAIALLKGKQDKVYASRSHHDASLIASLINAGYSFEEVLELFEKNETSGKYHELKKTNGSKAAIHYVSKSYSEAEQWTQSHESKARQTANSAIKWAESTPWQGRTGAIDQLIYLAHATIAHKAGRLTYVASCRDLAELAGIGKTTATRATWRLCKSGLIVLSKKAIADSANIFQLGSLDNTGHSPRTPNVRKCPTTSNHDVFRHNGLGKSAGQVWKALSENPATLKELAKITGRHIKTIKSAVLRMTNLANPLTGECLPMVTSADGKTWRAVEVDLDLIARIIGTAGTGEKQKRRHAHERYLHTSSLENGRKHKQG